MLFWDSDVFQLYIVIVLVAIVAAKDCVIGTDTLPFWAGHTACHFPSVSLG
jgi:hypothetical protein